MRKLSLVVNCTDRKRVRPSANAMARNLPVGTVPDRAEEWSHRLAKVEDLGVLSDLYMGEAWVQVLGLRDDIAADGVDVSLFVASAGLGLRSVDDPAPSYAATFASGHPDSVVSAPTETQQWWADVNSSDPRSKLEHLGSEPVLFVLSDNYARALHQDLARIGRLGVDCLIVGGWRDLEGMQRVPADRALRKALGGTVSSLNVRMARTWWARRASPSLVGPADQQNWASWATSARVVESWGRRHVTDSDLVDLARDLKARDSTMSASRALRLLRDGGIACEQARFAKLFNSSGVI